jgi:DNA-binding transcriptional ArsR family regulator
MAEVWKLQLAHGPKLVLLALADHAHDDGTSVHPSVDRIAWKTDLQRRTVQRALRSLENTGLIEAVTAARNRPTEYRLRLERGVKKSPFQPKGRQGVASGRHSVPPGGGTTPPESSVEPSRTGLGDIQDPENRKAHSEAMRRWKKKGA